jgi:hypothetical protein
MIYDQGRDVTRIAEERIDATLVTQLWVISADPRKCLYEWRDGTKALAQRISSDVVRTDRFATILPRGETGRS